MNLFITSREREPGADALYLDASTLRLSATHLALASRTWDGLYIELDECIPQFCLKYIKDKVKEIHVAPITKCDNHILKLLIELFPELEGKLRKQYMIGGDINELLPRLWRFAH